ncbi:hypothetical protein AJ78_00453 [Emergomyces pasteurianus Ep9510]|uniref:Uncharacterized protein n=1 Tax=Emergomyces pasteurianus Ep9510 TaxID=1447872 RepID=A0A1J9QUP7_9EURO|nr:hypothetical protein AJ78_00453 [Emergomyces pasteurianus Ep9510]
MVIGLLTIASIPTVIGVCEGVSEQRKANKRKSDEKRLEKFYLDVFCEANSEEAKRLQGQRVVLRDSKLYIDSPTRGSCSIPSHTAEAFYISYPDDEREPTLGLVSTVSVDPPMLNWIYVDKDTFELKYGNRTQSREHLVGPWDWTEDQIGVTVQDIEGFVAVEEEEGVWAVYFDARGDGLRWGIGRRKRVVEISLERRLLKPKEETEKEETKEQQKVRC